MYINWSKKKWSWAPGLLHFSPYINFAVDSSVRNTYTFPACTTRSHRIPLFLSPLLKRWKVRASIDPPVDPLLIFFWVIISCISPSLSFPIDPPGETGTNHLSPQVIQLHSFLYNDLFYNFSLSLSLSLLSQVSPPPDHAASWDFVVFEERMEEKDSWQLIWEESLFFCKKVIVVISFCHYSLRILIMMIIMITSPQ